MLDRRSFLNIVSLAATVSAVRPSLLAEVVGDSYSNSRLGLSLMKPSGWRFASVVDFEKAKQETVYLDLEPEIVEAIEKGGELPTLMITKFGPEYDDLTPAILLWDEPEPLPDSEIGFHEEALRGFAAVFREFEIRTEPERVELSGAAGTRSEWSFLFEHESKRTWKVDAATLLIFRESRVHTFHFLQGREKVSRAQESLLSTERSIRYRASREDLQKSPG